MTAGPNGRATGIVGIQMMSLCDNPRMDSLFFYWLIAAVVAMPVVLIVKGLTAGKRKDS